MDDVGFGRGKRCDSKLFVRFVATSCSKDARNGLRGVRIGETSHPGPDGGLMLRLRRGQNRFSVLSDDVSQGFDIESVIDALEFDLSREED